jgi:hypothetical protein
VGFLNSFCEVQKFRIQNWEQFKNPNLVEIFTINDNQDERNFKVLF